METTRWRDQAFTNTKAIQLAQEQRYLKLYQVSIYQLILCLEHELSFQNTFLVVGCLPLALGKLPVPEFCSTQHLGIEDVILINYLYWYLGHYFGPITFVSAPHGLNHCLCYQTEEKCFKASHNALILLPVCLHM